MRRSETLRKVPLEVDFRSIFCAPSRKLKILATPKVLVHGKSYEHGFVKKYDGHKLCAKSRTKSCLNQFFVTIPEIQNTGHSQRICSWEVVRAGFHEKT
ncbi:hypothetical protein BHM03_00058387 [Ensete ventricosum]|nr:hypothetical protein BHM03_00058387 [Ensete ventricosum]